ncbi:MAG TPA: uracil-DNA glycosylase family protein [Longimicrobiales bacterium]|nr:uracil-DNA glycosylase family protein [Longimicrobiales bacterium]
MSAAAVEEDRYRRIFRAAHADHATCAADEWLDASCRSLDGTPADRPLVWSRRNGPWRRVDVLWVGAAPGNAGGLGSGSSGAHGTRIPFGGDIAGANLDVLLSSIGITRNDTFIVASLNALPARGGGEPTVAELAAPVGTYPDSIALLRDGVVASGPRLIVALGLVALRSLGAALTGAYDADVGAPVPRTEALRLPSTARLAAAGLVRGTSMPWPGALALSDGFVGAWRDAWGSDAFHVLPLMHPSAQNMSPFARRDTLFHQRMLDARAALVGAARNVLGYSIPDRRPPLPADGIYALPEWRDPISSQHARLDGLWRAHGV